MAAMTKFVDGGFFICVVFTCMGKNPVFYLSNPRMMHTHATPSPLGSHGYLSWGCTILPSDLFFKKKSPKFDPFQFFFAITLPKIAVFFPSEKDPNYFLKPYLDNKSQVIWPSNGREN